MSLVPFVLNEMLGDSWDFRPQALFDQNFGLGLLNDDLLFPQRNLMYYRPWRNMTARNSGMSNVQYDKDAFRANLDVQQFKPEEIVVKTVGNDIVVEGNHEERQDEHGFISRRFQRRYALPKDIDPDNVVSKLSSDGILTIEAPRKALPQPKGERAVPIAQTGAPAVTRVPKQKAKGQEEPMVQ